MIKVRLFLRMCLDLPLQHVHAKFQKPCKALSNRLVVRRLEAGDKMFEFGLLGFKIGQFRSHPLQFDFEQGDFRISPAGQPGAIREEFVDQPRRFGIAVILQRVEDRGDLLLSALTFKAQCRDGDEFHIAHFKQRLEGDKAVDDFCGEIQCCLIEIG
ncbi:MAG: hypothetical protein MUC40_01260 [Akkermansiaceae bacterium]|nr:hypothetical protein [Akkermansiaceae bacterium]